VDCGCFGSGGGGIDAKWFAEHAAMLALGLAVTAGEFLKARSPKRMVVPGLRDLAAPTP
jgi:hypothetical protein